MIFFFIYDVITSPEMEKRPTIHYSHAAWNRLTGMVRSQEDL